MHEPQDEDEMQEMTVNDLMGIAQPQEDKSPIAELITKLDIELKSEVTGNPPSHISVSRAKFFADRYNLNSVNMFIETELALLVSRDRKGRTEILKAMQSVLPAQYQGEEGRGFWSRLLR